MNESSKFFNISLIISALFLLFYLFTPFISHAVTATILAIATSSLNERIHAKIIFGNYFTKKVLTSATLSLVVFAFLFTPFVYLISYMFDFLTQFDKNEITLIFQKSYEYVKNLAEEFSFLKPYFEIAKSSIDSIEVGKNIAQVALNKTISIFKGIGNLSYDIALVMIFYFLINIYGKIVFFYVAERAPLKKVDKRLLYCRFSTTVSSTFYAAIFNIFTQGLAFFLLIYFIDSKLDAVFLGLMAGFLSIIPFVGNAIVFIPVAIYEILHQNYLDAIIIILYSFIVMGFVIDNILRAIFIRFLSKLFGYRYRLHELLLILSIASGIMVFGFWGVIYGPALLALSLAIFDMQKSSRLST